MEIKSAQSMMKSLYGERDKARGSEQTFLWLIEEVGEMDEALRRSDKNGLNEEFADVLVWLFSLGNILGIDLEYAFRAKYHGTCPKCTEMPCQCKELV
jgi:NTP pyrophosphatase (non-canonical NTP hydrolase)